MTEALLFQPTNIRFNAFVAGTIGDIQCPEGFQDCCTGLENPVSGAVSQRFPILFCKNEKGIIFVQNLWNRKSVFQPSYHHSFIAILPVKHAVSEIPVTGEEVWPESCRSFHCLCLIETVNHLPVAGKQHGGNFTSFKNSWMSILGMFKYSIFE